MNLKTNNIMYEDLKLYLASSFTLLFTTFNIHEGLEDTLIFTTIIYTLVRIYKEIVSKRNK
jgi:hypothetical protein